MEAALEQACNAEELQSSECLQRSSATLSKQQTSQVLRVLEEAFSAQIYYLQQVRRGRGGGPSKLVTFCCCATRNSECQVLTSFGLQQEFYLHTLFFFCHPSLQVDASRYGDPFVFATFRSLCSWLAEETSCLKEEVTQLLPFLVGYARNHMRQGDGPEQSLAQWMAELSLSDETAEWSGREALR